MDYGPMQYKIGVVCVYNGYEIYIYIYISVVIS